MIVRRSVWWGLRRGCYSGGSRLAMVAAIQMIGEPATSVAAHHRLYHDPMITPEMLEILRCPMHPKREAKLVVEDSRLLCARCRVQYRIREGFPSILIEEATLPEGCARLNQLPCQRK